MRAPLALLLLAGCQQPMTPPDAGTKVACLPKLTGPTHFDVDLRVATLSGSVTVNGAALPDSPAPMQPDAPDARAWLVLTGPFGDTYELPLGRTGPAHFSGLLFEGSYQVDLRTAADAQLRTLPRGVVTHLADALTLQADEVMDFDVPLVAVSGTVTRDGGAWPDAAASRGNVTFNDSLNGSRYQFDVGATGPAQYQGSVFGGTYNVTFVGGADDAPLPAYAPVSLERGRLISTAAPRDYDVVTVTVQGTVTLNGGALPDSPMLGAGSRGVVVFTDLATLEVFTFPVGATGPGAYAGLLPTGTYGVSFGAVSSVFVVGLPSAQHQELLSALEISAPLQRDFDLTVATVSGAITWASAALPDADGGTRGSVVFTQRPSGDPSFFDVALSGPATYSGSVFGGDYDVAFVAGDGVAGLPPLRPGSLELGAHVGGPRPHDYDLQLNDVTIELALDGGELGDGGVLLADGATGFLLQLPPGPGPGTFTAQLFTGHYDVRLSLGSRGQLILQQQATIAPGLGPLVYDVPFFELSGTATLNGLPMPDGPRGTLTLNERLTGWPVPLTFAQTGPATFSGQALSGAYNLLLLTDVQAEQVGLPASVETQIATGCLR